MRIDEATRTEGAEKSESAAFSGLAFQTGDYADEIAELGIDPAQAEEFLQIIWDIMGRFVRLGIDVEICERIFDNANIGLSGEPTAIDPIPPPPTTEKPDGGKRDA